MDESDDDDLRALEALLEQARLAFERPEHDSMLSLIDALKAATKRLNDDQPALVRGRIWSRLADAQNMAADFRSDTDMFDESIACYDTALTILPRGTLHDKVQLNRLMAFNSRARLLGDLDALREVIAVGEALIDSFGPDTEPGDRIAAQERVGVSEIGLADDLGDIALKRRARDRFAEAYTDAKRENLPDRAARAAINMALIERGIGEFTGEIEPIRSAVATLEEVVESLDPNLVAPDLLQIAIKNLAVAQRALGQFSGDRELLWRSIRQFDRGAKAYEADGKHGRWADLQMQRALSLQQLAEMSDDVALLRSAIADYDAALEVMSPQSAPIDWAISTMNRGNAQRLSGLMGSSEQSYDDAMDCYDRALEVYLELEEPVRVAKTRANMAMTQLEIGRRRRDREALDHAEANLCAVWDIFDRESAQHWANMRVVRGRIDLARGVLSGKEAHFQSAHRWFSEAESVFDPDKVVSDWAGLQMFLAEAEAGLNEWESVEKRTAKLLEVMLSAVLSAKTRQNQDELLWQVRGAADLRALARLRLGDTIGAWDVLFQGRNVQHSAQRAIEDLVAGDTAAVVRLRQLRAAWIDASNHLEHLQRLQAEASDGTDLESEIREAEAALRQAASDIDVLSPGPSIDGLYRNGDTLPSSVTLVALLVTRSGGALLLQQQGVDPVVHELPRLTTAVVERLLLGPAASEGCDDPLLKDFDGWFPSYKAFQACGTHPSNRDMHRWNEAICRLLDCIWPLFMGDVDAALSHLPTPPQEVVLHPPGRLSYLPLHAARHLDSEGRYHYFCDRWSLSLAPNPASLPEPSQLATRPAGARQLLAVSPLVSQPEDIPAWDSFADENRQFLCGSKATIDNLSAAFPRAEYVSVLCHGVNDPASSDRSGLEMSDALLTLANIREADLRAVRLACLTACETGLLHSRLAADEFHGLPSGLMSAGVPAVVATLWMVERHSASRITQSLFTDHLRGSPPALALRNAQQTLREEQGRDGLAPIVEQAAIAVVPKAPKPQRSGLLGFGGPLKKTEQDVPALSDDAPFHWAGFVVYGR